MPLRTMQSGGPGLREASPAGTHEAVVDGVAVRADRAWCPGLRQWLQVRRVQGRLCRADQEASSRGGKVTLQRVNAGSGHYYKIDGHKVDSVTELIRGGWPPDLTRAAAVAVAEHVADHDDEVELLRDGTRLAMVETLAGEPQRKWRTKRDRGTRVHAAIARDDRPLPDVALQLAAYRHAEWILGAGGDVLDLGSFRIRGGLVVHLRPDGYDVHRVECGQVVYRDFLNVAAVPRARRDRAGSWLSVPLLPPLPDGDTP